MNARKKLYRKHFKYQEILKRTEIRKNIVVALMRNVSSLQDLVLLLNTNIDSYSKKRIKYTYLPFFIAQAKEEQELSLNKDSKSVYRYKARFKIQPFDLQNISGYELLCKYGLYNKYTNINGVVKDHKYSVAEGYRNNVSPEILGQLKNCQFLRFKDNLAKSDRCSISLNDLIK